MTTRPGRSPVWALPRLGSDHHTQPAYTYPAPLTLSVVGFVPPSATMKTRGHGFRTEGGTNDQIARIVRAPFFGPFVAPSGWVELKPNPHQAPARKDDIGHLDQPIVTRKRLPGSAASGQ